MKATLLHKATIVTSEKEAMGSILIVDDKIEEVIYADREDFDYYIYNISSILPSLINIEPTASFPAVMIVALCRSFIIFSP